MFNNGKATNYMYWLGLRQHCSGCSFEWNDLSVVDYTHWNDGEPNNAGNGEDCVQAYDWSDDGIPPNFGWNDDDCNKETMGWICEAYTEKFHQPVDPWLPGGTPNTYGCKAGWTKFGGGCFRYFGDKNDPDHHIRKTWHEAKYYCQQTWSGKGLVWSCPVTGMSSLF